MTEKQGKDFWILHPPGMPMGCQILGDAPSSTPKMPKLWVDVCALGQHMPQMHGKHEIRPLTPSLALQLGLCPECMGYGDRTPLSADMTALQILRGIDEVHDKCTACNGSGRPAILPIMRRHANETSVTLQMSPHPYVPTLPSNFYTSLMELFQAPTDMCLACGAAKESYYNEEPLHNGAIDITGRDDSLGPLLAPSA
jgi:hypothetical protein